MNIFEIIDHNVTFSPQALMLQPFRDIWENDPSEDKIQAIAELSYVYYMRDQRSDYQYILNKDERHEQIVTDVTQLDINWVVPEYIYTAMDFYEKMSETTSTRLLKSTRGVIEKISGFLDNVDVNERDLKTHKPIFDIGKVVSAVEKIPKLTKALNEIEEEVIKEKELKGQSGNRDIGLFDDDGI